MKFRIQYNQRNGAYRVQYKRRFLWQTHSYLAQSMSPYEPPTSEPYWYSTQAQAMLAAVALKSTLLIASQKSNRWKTVQEFK